MTKKATLTPITDVPLIATSVNTQLNAINDKLDNTLSLDGSTPNDMSADLDMDSNDILNVNSMGLQTLVLNGITQESSFSFLGPWATATSYSINEIVTNDNKQYIAETNHASVIFADDLASNKWTLFLEGVTGATGATGSAGAVGQGVPVGGTTGQALTKIDGDNYNTQWTTSSGDMVTTNNLSDVANAGTSRTNLGVAIGSDVQAWDAVLDATTASFLTADETKLDGIETSATADQTGAQIKTAYEAEANAFTDAQFTKLAGIETSATADQTAGDIEAIVDHDNLVGFAAAEHIDWALTNAANIHADNYTDTDTTYTSSDFTHDDLTGFVAAEHIDWALTNAANIHADNYTDTDTTYSIQDGELSQINFTTADNTKLDGIEALADVTDATNVAAALTLTGDVTTSAGFATTIAAKAVDVAMLADGTDGELITWSATGVAAVVAVGTDGQVLTSGGVGVAPTFETLAGGGDALVANGLDQFAATTSLELKGVISDESGSGALVFATSPTLVTPALGTPSALVGTSITGTGSGFTAGNVTTNANLTGHITSTGNAAILGSFTMSQLSAAVSDGTVSFATGVEDNADVTDAANVASALTNGVAALTSGEVTQLANIGFETISAAEWGFVAAATAAYTSGEATKLGNIESLADVTDTANVTSSGAVMDSEVTNLADVKAFDTTDYATSTQGSTADSAMQDLVDDTTPQLGGFLDTNANMIKWSKGADIASGTTLTLLTDGNYFHVSGTTTIAGISSATTLGTTIRLRFNSTCTLTNSATFLLPGAADFTTSLNDIFDFTQVAGGPTWYCSGYILASGKAISQTYNISMFQVDDDGTTGQTTTGSAAVLVDIWNTPSLIDAADFTFVDSTGLLTVLTAGILEVDVKVSSWQDTVNSRHSLHVILEKNSSPLVEGSSYTSRDNTADEGQVNINGYKVAVAVNDTFRLTISDIGVAAEVGAAAVAGQTYFGAKLYK